MILARNRPKWFQARGADAAGRSLGFETTPESKMLECASAWHLQPLKVVFPYARILR